MRVIGMLSGTSYDGVDALVCDLDLDGDALVCDLVAHRAAAYPEELRRSIAAVLPPAETTIEAVCRLDVELGGFFGALVAGLEAAHGPAEVVCSHGQTVYYWVDATTTRGTLQLGQPAFIAERTAASVVSDVRNRDIAAGGNGAPLASLLDLLLLPADGPEVVGSLNLGGIANVTVLGGGRTPIAYDIGPANALIDAAVDWVTGGRAHFDRDGALAASGAPDAGLVAALCDDPYFDVPPPKGTGKELFNLDYLTSRLAGRSLAPADLVASVTEATAAVVAASLATHGLDALYAAGGGVRNPTLMSALASRLAGVPIRPVDELGVPEAAKEALLFAVVGFLTAHGIPATVPSCTGASRPTVLGSVTPGAAPLPARHPALAAPRRLVVRTCLGARG